MGTMPNQSSAARIGFFSLRSRNRHVSRCLAYEGEDLIQQIDDVDLIIPETSRNDSKFVDYFGSLLKRRLSLQFGTLPKLARHRHDRNKGKYDVFVFFCQTLADLALLNQSFPDWRSHTEKAIVFVDEFWLRVVDNWPQSIKPLKAVSYTHLTLPTKA